MLKYKEIAQDLRDKIVSGIYKVNEQLPFEREMSINYNVSRITIRKAVDLLVAEGLIVKRRGAGTFVKDINDEEAIEIAMKKQFLGFSTTYSGHNVKSKVINFKIINPDEKTANKLKIGRNEFIYHIERVRYLDNEPFVLEKTFMPITLIPGLQKKDLESSIYDYIENVLKLKIQSSHRTVRAGLPTEKEQKYLRIDKCFPVLEGEQVAFLNNGQAFEYSISRHRGDRAEFKMINIKE
jgi:GntR family transcriptional regulator